MTDRYVHLDEDTERLVKRACNRCYGRGVSVLELPAIEVVSQYGTAHKAAGNGSFGPRNHHTDCGIDATGTQWWWAE